MIWFPKPDVVSQQVQQFLEMEKECLMGGMEHRENIIP